MNGVVVIDKPAGITSHDVVYRVRKIAGQKRIGHAGTLDPDATGVLLVCLGHATRLSDLLADQGKVYDTVLRLGATTSTEDSSGEILSIVDPSEITQEALLSVLPQFVGKIAQVPPMVSAVHHEGQRLYDLARQGITVERQARTVEVKSIALLSFTQGAECSARLRVDCGKGTYIRTLCADIGDMLEVGGHMASLRRTSVGSFSVESAIPLADLTIDTLSSSLVSSSDAVSFLKLVCLNNELAADVLNGKKILTEEKFTPGELVRLTKDQTLVSLARFDGDGCLSPEKVFPPQE